MKMSKKLMVGIIPLFLIATSGCQNADPASRSNSSAYDDLISNVRVDNKSSLVINVRLGDGLIASADGGGDSQTNTPTRTTDVSPQTSLAWGGSSSGVGGEQRTDAISGFEKILKALKDGAQPPALTPGERNACAGCCSDCRGE